MKRVAILGAGLSGLSTAWYLKKRGLIAHVFEASGHAGGVVRSSSEEGFLFENGPNSLLLSEGDLYDLVLEMDLTTQIVEANPHSKKRFIVRDGKPASVPLSLFQFISSSLLSSGGKLRLLAEPFQKPCRKNDESLASFAERRLGKEVLDYLLNPFVSGVYAGKPEKLSARYAFPSMWEMEQKHGSLLRGFLKRPKKKDSRTRHRLVSFRDGIQTLTDAMAHKLRNQLRLNTSVQSIRRENEQWLINDETFDAVISTLPLHQLPDFQSSLSNLKSEISYAPLCVFHLGFNRDQIRHPLDGFGMLVPEVEKMNILGCLFPSTLFPDRAPEDQVLLTVFVGGSRQPDLASLPEETSLDLVLADLRPLLGLHGKPLWKKYLHWDKAIPQYGLEHGSFLKDLSDFEERNAGWFFSGSYRNGVSVPNCISSAKKTAQAVLDYLSRSV